MLSPDHGSSEVRHGFGCTGSLCVDSTNQIDGSIKPRGVRPKTVVSMTERNPSKIRKRLPQFFFPPEHFPRSARKTGPQILFSALRAENRTSNMCCRAQRGKQDSKNLFPRSARKKGPQIFFSALRAENRTSNMCCRAQRGKQHSKYLFPYALHPKPSTLHFKPCVNPKSQALFCKP